MFEIYNTLSRKKEVFEPIVAGRAGMYVCGPTVYGDPHLGHARPAVTFDLLFRYLLALGYRVRYVRNITDVGHLENDADEGEDKIAKKARLEQLEPMEIAQHYTRRYHEAMRALNVLPPNIEPTASGHIIEQIEMVRRILDAGYAYEAGGSVYFDVGKYDADFGYGRLSGRSLEDMQSGSRALDGQDDKRSPYDFALWKKAAPEHIMRWPSPWSDGFPGWHMECSAMSLKYLGERFDIHGGGMDLVFPHHEAEIAQGNASCGCSGVGAKYWMHNNMLTINGQKMGKSLGNFITLEQLFTGNHPLLAQAYSPMTIRFFMLQAHYRSTLDFSNEALQAAEKGLDRLMKAVETLNKLVGLKPGESRATSRPSVETGGSESTGKSGFNPSDLEKRLREAMDDDLNSALAIAALFDWVSVINKIHDGSITMPEADLTQLREIFQHWIFDILGLRDGNAAAGTDHLTPVMEMVLALRAQAKADKNWALSDQIRNALTAAGIRVKDNKDGSSDWEVGTPTADSATQKKI
ncbi:MAG: cysteine--tRNA ligase [Alistipes sp.]|jgi:cysteinyl-tRNA synthetase|nr:cysteine--tRNA ligase [Alistipes sp.]